MKRPVLVFLLLLLCIVVAVLPLILISDSEFQGADGQAQDVIMEISPDYEVWAEPMIEPPGAETESLLFALQAAIGGSGIGGIFGYLIARKKYRTDEHSTMTEEV